jgi:hypothetical protein
MPVWWSNAGLAHKGGAENNAAFVSVASKAPSSCATIPDAAPGTWIGSSKTGKHIDPFLSFDHFGSSNPDDYILGFPMHPHRGIETVTYMLKGAVNHRDSL